MAVPKTWGGTVLCSMARSKLSPEVRKSSWASADWFSPSDWDLKRNNPVRDKWSRSRGWGQGHDARLSQGPTCSCDNERHRWAPRGFTFGISSLQYGGRHCSHQITAEGVINIPSIFDTEGEKHSDHRSVLQPKVQDEGIKDWARGRTAIFSLFLHIVFNAFFDLYKPFKCLLLRLLNSTKPRGEARGFRQAGLLILKLVIKPFCCTKWGIDHNHSLLFAPWWPEMCKLPTEKTAQSDVCN